MKSTHQFIFSKWHLPELLLVCLFVLAPVYYHPNLGGEGLRIPNNSTVWLLAIIFIAYTLLKVVQSHNFKLPKYFIYIAAFPLLVILSGFVAGVEQPLKWLFRVLFILGGFAFFFSLFQHNFKQGKWDRLLLVVALSGLIHIVIGLMQIYLKEGMPYLLPKSPQGIPSGLFQQINNQATFLVTIILLVFYLASRPILRSSGFIFKLLTVVTVLGASFIVGFAGSRIGLLSLILALPMLLLARRQYLEKNKQYTVLLLFMLLLGMIFGAVTTHGKAMDKTVAMQSGYSGSARLGIYKISLDLMSEKPLFGQGIGSFPRVFQYAKPAFYQQNPNAKLPQQMVSHPHNELLQWVVEGGITALVGILLFAVGVMLALKQNGRSRGLAYFALLLPIALHTQVELPFYMSALHWFLFIFLLVQIFNTELVIKQNKLSEFGQKFTALSIMLIALIMLIFFAHTIRANWDFIAFYKNRYSEQRLSVAKGNPYLSEQARWMDMTTMLYTSIEYGLDANVEYYANWGQGMLKSNPNPELFVLLAKAYEYLGERNLYCENAMLGLNVYPKEQRLRAFAKACRN